MMIAFRYYLLIIIFSCSLSAKAEDLISIYQQALQADPQLKSSEIKTEIGADQKGQAFGQMLPQINASANWSKNEQSIQSASTSNNSDYNGARYFISLNQTLFDFSKYWEWQRTSKIEDQYTREATQAKNQLMFKVVDLYFNALEAEDQLKFAKTEKDSFQKQLEQIQKLFAKQLLKITDLYAAEARLDQLSAEIILAESNVNTALEDIRELTGTTPSTLNNLRETIEFIEISGEIQQWIEMAQVQNPAISAKKIAISAAENNVNVQKSKYLPIVDLQLSYYDTNTGFQSSNLGSDTKTSVAAINVNIPIFTGGTTTHQVHEAERRVQLSKNENESIIRAVIKETSDAFYSTNVGVRQIQSSIKALKSTSKSREAMERGYQLGVVTISDVIKSQQEELSAKKKLSQAKYNYIKNRIRFMNATGSIKEENLQEINHWLESKDKGSLN